MAKKRNWLERLKQFFGGGDKLKQEKDRRKKWLFGRFKLRSSPALPAPAPPIAIFTREADEEQNKYAMAVAMATAIAAEAAIAAAEAAAQVVRRTGVPLLHNRRREIAATKIQIAFRGYLARKALRALKGLVRLQALIRGQAVRRQTTMTLRSLQSLIRIQEEARESRMRIAADRQAFEDKDIVNEKIKKLGETRTTIQQYSGRNWDSSTLSKEDINTMLKSRLIAALKRGRALEYASTYQERRNLCRPTTPKEIDIPNQQWNWLDHWVGEPSVDKDIYQNVPAPSPEHDIHDSRLHTPDSFVLLDTVHNENAEQRQLRNLARRSFNRSRRTSLRDDESITSSPCIPSYMASTASTKARFRSMSTPKQRISLADFGATDACSDHCGSITNSLLSPFPSVVSEAGIARTGNHHMSRQKSPSQRGQAGPVRSRRSSKYLSFDSECSLLNWDRHNVIR